MSLLIIITFLSRRWDGITFPNRKNKDRDQFKELDSFSMT